MAQAAGPAGWHEPAVVGAEEGVEVALEPAEERLTWWATWSSMPGRAACAGSAALAELPTLYSPTTGAVRTSPRVACPRCSYAAGWTDHSRLAQVGAEAASILPGRESEFASESGCPGSRRRR